MGALPAALGDQFRGAGDLQRVVAPICSESAGSAGIFEAAVSRCVDRTQLISVAQLSDRVETKFTKFTKFTRLYF